MTTPQTTEPCSPAIEAAMPTPTDELNKALAKLSNSLSRKDYCIVRTAMLTLFSPNGDMSTAGGSNPEPRSFAGRGEGPPAPPPIRERPAIPRNKKGGGMKAADISDMAMLEAIRDRRIPLDDVGFPDYPSKVVHAKLLKLDKRGLTEYGVSARTCWLTDKGKAELKRLLSGSGQ